MSLRIYVFLYGMKVGVVLFNIFYWGKLYFLLYNFVGFVRIKVLVFKWDIFLLGD